MESSDLIDWAHHEHAHLSRLFEDLQQTFARIGAGEVEEDSVAEVLEVALEDLAGALEDMLEHFGEEEEVYFVEIEQRFPQFAARIELLVQVHERICVQTRALDAQIRRYKAEPAAQSLAALGDGVRALAAEVQAHNTQEQAVFADALRQMSEMERQQLMAHKRALGG
jgi:hypothetical protein